MLMILKLKLIHFKQLEKIILNSSITELIPLYLEIFIIVHNDYFSKFCALNLVSKRK